MRRTQVYNKNLINVDGSNISLQLRKRRESARHMRHALLSDDQTRRRNTASAGLRRKTKKVLTFVPGFEIRSGGAEPWRPPVEASNPG